MLGRSLLRQIGRNSPRIRQDFRSRAATNFVAPTTTEVSHDETTITKRSCRWPRRPREWGRAMRALRALLANPDDTMLAFEIFDAIDRDVEERAFQRFRRDPVGRLVATRPSLPRG